MSARDDLPGSTSPEKPDGSARVTPRCASLLQNPGRNGDATDKLAAGSFSMAERVGGNVRELRLAQDQTVMDVAIGSNVLSDIIEQAEAGNIELFTDELHALARYFGVSVNRLFVGV